MANTTDDKKYWVRSLKTDGSYEYSQISDTDASSYLGKNPNAQVIMRNEDGLLMPFDLGRLDIAKSLPNTTIYGITQEEKDAFDSTEMQTVRKNPSVYKAFDNVMKDYNVPRSNEFYKLMACTLGAETNFGNAGRVSPTGARGLMQITESTFNYIKDKYHQDYEYIKRRFNNGNDFTQSDLENPELDEAGIAFGIIVWKDKCNVAGVDMQNLDSKDLAHLYAKYYNTGDINNTVEGHEENFKKNMPQWMATFTRGRRYSENIESNAPAVSLASSFATIQEKLNPSDVSTLSDIDNLADEKDEQDIINANMKSIVDRASNEVELKAQTEIARTTSAYTPERAVYIGINTLGEIEKESQKYYEEAWTAYATSKETNTKIRDRFRNDYINSLEAEVATEINEWLDGDIGEIVKGTYGIDLSTATEEEVDAAVQASNQDLDALWNSIPEEDREGLIDFIDLLVQSYNIVQSEILDADAEKWGKAFYDALINKIQPKSDMEYMAISALTGSMIGKLSTLGADKRSRQLMDEQLAGYNAGGILQGVAQFGAGLMDMPIILAGGAVGGAIFKGMSTLTNNATLKFLTNLYMKGGKVAQAAKSTTNVAKNTVKQLAVNSKWARAKLTEFTSNKILQFGVNTAREGFSSAFGMTLQNVGSQVLSPYEFNSKAVVTSFAQGFMLGAIDPAKQILPGWFGKWGAKKTSLGRKVAAGAGIWGTRIGFEATVESSVMSLTDLAINGDVREFNFINAVQQESPFTLALGFPEWLEPVSSKGAFGKFKERAGAGRLALNSTDWDNINRVTKFDVHSYSDIAKLSQAEKKYLTKMMESDKMPISTRNKFALISGEVGTKVSFSNVGSIHSMEIIKEEDGTFTYQSIDNQGRIIFAQNLGYEEATAEAYKRLNQECYDIDVINSQCTRLAGVDYSISHSVPYVAKITNLQKEFLSKAVDANGKKYGSFQEAELAVLTLMSDGNKPYELRTDAERANIENYKMYLANASANWNMTEYHINQTAVALNITPQDVRKMLASRNRTGMENQMYEVYQAIERGDSEIPDNDAMRKANEQRNAKLRQKEENKQPVTLTPSEETEYLDGMTSDEQIKYLNQQFISSDDTVEFVTFSDGNTLVRVTEITGNVVFKDVRGNNVELTDAQQAEYSKGGISSKVSVEDAIQRVQDIQDRNAEARDEALSSDNQDVDGNVFYIDNDGNSQVAEVAKVNGLGDITLQDGTVIPNSQVQSLNVNPIVAEVTDVIQNGFEQIDNADSKKYWRGKRSSNYGAYIKGMKESFPSMNLSADINNKISSLTDDINKLKTKLAELTKQEKELGGDLSLSKREIEKKIADQTKELDSVETLREEYYRTYPSEKTQYEWSKKVLERELAQQIQHEAKKRVDELEKQAQARNEKQLKEQPKEQETSKKKQVSEAELAKQKTKLMDFLLNPFNSEFNIRKFFDELHEFAKDTEMEDERIFNKVAFLKIGNSIVKGLKELHKAKANQQKGLDSLDPDVLATAYKMKSSFEKNIADVENRLIALLNELEGVMKDYPEYEAYYSELKQALGENREPAKNIENLLKPQPIAQPIITVSETPAKVEPTKVEETKVETVETKKGKNNKKAKKEKVEEQAPAQAEEPVTIPIEMNMDYSAMADDTTAETIEPTNTETTTEPIKAEEKQPTEEKIEETVNVKSSNKEKKLPPKPKAKSTKKKVPVKIKPKKFESTGEPVAPKIPETPRLEAVPEQIDYVKNTSLNDAKTKHALSFNLKLGGEIKDSRDVTPDGYTIVSYNAEIEMSGYADNNSLGGAYDLISKSGLYDLKASKSNESDVNESTLDRFKAGDTVKVTNPKMEVVVTYDTDGSIKSIVPYCTDKGRIVIEPMRAELPNTMLNHFLIKELNAYDISIRYGNEGEFSSDSEQAFYDTNRHEIVINKNADLNAKRW